MQAVGPKRLQGRAAAHDACQVVAGQRLSAPDAVSIDVDRQLWEVQRWQLPAIRQHGLQHCTQWQVRVYPTRIQVQMLQRRPAAVCQR
jgi:hypothetical protein